MRRGGAVRTAVVTVKAWRGRARLGRLRCAGPGRPQVHRLRVQGLPQGRYTTLQETDDRILATSLVARWRYEGADVDWNAAYDDVLNTLLETFATTYSRALQETLYLMGQRVLESRDDVAEVRFSAPNKHHFLVDLEPFGLKNDGEVFIAADRPYGLIEAVVARDDASDAGDAWLAVPAFV